MSVWVSTGIPVVLPHSRSRSAGRGRSRAREMHVDLRGGTGFFLWNRRATPNWNLVGRPESPIADLMGVQPGLYRVKVTHPDKDIPAKYNEETTLGLDLAPEVSGYSSVDRFKFKLKSR